MRQSGSQENKIPQIASGTGQKGKKNLARALRLPTWGLEGSH
jgi:hypothetical protein